MKSMHLVDPELVSLIDQMPKTDFSRQGIAQTRLALSRFLSQMTVLPSLDIELTEVLIPRPHGGSYVRALLYRPGGTSGLIPAFLHLHGGAYCVGTPEMNDGLNRERASQLGCAILSVDYRLAPDSCHPAAVEDAYLALCYLHREASTLGLDPHRIAVGGESAGGGLAAALALLARDRNGPSLCFQLLIYPMLDDRVITDQPHPFAGDFMFTQKDAYTTWAHYLGHEPGKTDTDCYAAPARASDLRGLPETYISVGQLDLFVEENVEYARRLIRSGVLTELHVFPGAYHGADTFPATRIGLSMKEEHMRALALGLLKVR